MIRTQGVHFLSGIETWSFVEGEVMDGLWLVLVQTSQTMKIVMSRFLWRWLVNWSGLPAEGGSEGSTRRNSAGVGMGRGSGFPGCTTLFPNILKLVILFSNTHIWINIVDSRTEHPRSQVIRMQLQPQGPNSDVVHGFALGSSVSTYDWDPPSSSYS